MLPTDYFSSICFPEVLSSHFVSLKKNHQIILQPNVQNTGRKKKKRKKKAPIFELEDLYFSPGFSTYHLGDLILNIQSLTSSTF